LLESNTGAKAKDAIVTDDAVIFVVGEGELGKAVGRNGMNARRLSSAFKKGVEFVESAPDVKGFLGNVFRPAKLVEVREEMRDGKLTVTVSVDKADKGLAIGRGGERIKRARLLAKRHFGCEDVKIV
jgi:N utilization substance protein A